jgi:hypothetical protein
MIQDKTPGDVSNKKRDVLTFPQPGYTTAGIVFFAFRYRESETAYGNVWGEER